MADKNEDIYITPIWVHKFEEADSKTFCNEILKAGENPSMPIVIYIDSYGGSIDSLSAMLSAMDSVSNQIVTVAIGKAMSCGAILLSHGDVRYVAEHARVMVHEASGGSRGDVNDAVNTIQELKRVNEYFMGVLAKNCGKTLKEFKASVPTERRDRYMSAKESVKYGIADHVGVPKIVKTIKYDIVTK